MVKGEGFARVGGRKPLKDSKKIFDKGMRASKALRKNAEASQRDPQAIFKSLNPSFLSEFGQYYQSLPQNTAFTQFVQQLNQTLSAELGKTIALTSPLASGLVPFDLVAPSRLIYPVYSPLRNKLPRTQGQGTSRKVKVLTGVSGSHTGGTSVLRWSIPEFPGGGGLGATNWPNQLPGAGSQTAVDVSIPYKFFGITEALSWLAQFAGQGFEDVSALVNLVLLQEAMLSEEHAILQASGTNLAAPGTPTLAARAALTGEVGLTGVTTNVWARVTAVNFYGETTAAVGSVAASNGQVVDVTIAPSAGAAQYNVYIGTGAADPTRTSTFFSATVGGAKYTVQGAIPTSGNVAPAADSGTGSTNDYDGLFNILNGFIVSGTYPASGYKGGYIRRSTASQLTTAVLFDALQGLWDNSAAFNSSDSGGFRADPAELIVEGTDASNYAANVLSQASGGQQAYQIRLDQDDVGSIRAGAAIAQIQNPITRSMVSLVTHPYVQQGNAMLMSYQLPMSFSNVGNAWEVTNVQDYISISWPVIDVTFRYSLFLYGALVGIAPQYSAIIQGLQRTGTTAGGNWS